MTTKEKIYSLLENNQECYLSGAQMAKELEISRAAVWKGIKALQQEGIAIEGVTNRGYCLGKENDRLSIEGICQQLKNPQQFSMELLPQVDSTNTMLAKQGEEGAKEGTILLACTQTGGRGRLGRTFFSPEKTGLYFSLLLRPKFLVEQGAFVTTAAAVAVAQTLEEMLEEPVDIKWVNDIFYQGKKIGGILTQGAMSMENGGFSYMVLGIGINIYAPKEGFPGDVASLAGHAFPKEQKNLKNKLVAGILERFMEYYSHLEQKEFVAEYQKRSFVVGRSVRVLQMGQEKTAFVQGIDDNCHLHIVDEFGEKSILSSGEISIRL